MTCKLTTTHGSPKVDLYKINFGWGKPKKIEEISIDRKRGISLIESRDFEGGIEVGLALPKVRMYALMGMKMGVMSVDGFMVFVLGVLVFISIFWVWVNVCMNSIFIFMCYINFFFAGFRFSFF